MRYFEELLMAFLNELEQTNTIVNRDFATLMTDPSTKRMLFSSSQAARFMASDQLPDHLQERVRLPFDQVYIEFDEPIEVAYAAKDMTADLELHKPVPGELESVENAIFYLVGMILTDIKHLKETYPTPTEGVSKELWARFSRPKWPVRVDLMRLSNPFEKGLSYSIYSRHYYDMLTGESYILESDLRAGHQSGSDLTGADIVHGVVRVPREGPAGLRAGVYEEELQQYSALISWMLSYMTLAKGIEVVKYSPPRAERRRNQREGKKPLEWHVVKADASAVSKSTRRGSGSKHSYRYDVRGHWRFYQDKMVWIAPHQRGIANTEYVPSTSKFEGGRQIA